MTTFKGFLETGSLGPIAVGVSMDLVKEILGEPDDRSVKVNPQIWKYGGLQLAFSRTREEREFLLDFVGLYFSDPFASLPEPLIPEGWRLTSQSSFDEFSQYLAETDLLIIEQSPPQNMSLSHDQKLVEFSILLSSGVRVGFENDRLSSFQYLDRKESAKKQLSITIEKTDWELIRREAASLKLSVPALCARLITEHAHNLLKPVS